MVGQQQHGISLTNGLQENQGLQVLSPHSSESGSTSRIHKSGPQAGGPGPMKAVQPISCKRFKFFTAVFRDIFFREYPPPPDKSIGTRTKLQSQAKQRVSAVTMLVFPCICCWLKNKSNQTIDKMVEWMNVVVS